MSDTKENIQICNPVIVRRSDSEILNDIKECLGFASDEMRRTLRDNYNRNRQLESENKPEQKTPIYKEDIAKLASLANTLKTYGEEKEAQSTRLEKRIESMDSISEIVFLLLEELPREELDQVFQRISTRLLNAPQEELIGDNNGNISER